MYDIKLIPKFQINFCIKALKSTTLENFHTIITAMPNIHDISATGTLILKDEKVKELEGLEGMNTYRGWKILRREYWNNTGGHTSKNWRAINPKITTEWIWSNTLSELRRAIDNFWDHFYEQEVEVFDGMDDERKRVAGIILQQLGGNKFLAMTGSKNLSFSATSKNPELSMQLTKNKVGAKYLKIVLMPDDTYTMIFSKIVKNNLVTVKEYQGVYCDMLQSIFTKVTGLDTHL